jgi:hypothetical protein
MTHGSVRKLMGRHSFIGLAFETFSKFVGKLKSIFVKENVLSSLEQRFDFLYLLSS